MLDFLSAHVPPGASPMCGNSVCQDRRFLARYMPRLEAYFHYRNLDVSTLKELARRWKPQVMSGLVEAGQARGAGGHLRIDRRAAVLPRASAQVCRARCSALCHRSLSTQLKRALRTKTKGPAAGPFENGVATAVNSGGALREAAAPSPV